MDNVTEAKIHFRKERWKQFILERQASGLTIDKWCQEHGFKRSAYFYWLRRIRKEACQSLLEPQSTTPVPFVQIGTETVPDSATAQRLAVTSDTGIRIQLRGADITIANGTDPKTIRATLLALKELCYYYNNYNYNATTTAAVAEALTAHTAATWDNVNENTATCLLDPAEMFKGVTNLSDQARRGLMNAAAKLGLTQGQVA